MAHVAALAHVDIEPRLLQGRARHDFHVTLAGGGTEDQGHDLNQPPDADDEQYQDREQTEFAFDHVMIHSGDPPCAVATPAASTATGTGFSARTVFQTL